MSGKLQQQQKQQQQPLAEQTQGPHQTTETPEASGNCCEVLSYFFEEEEHEFKVDFRIEGIPQDAILEDRERMTQIKKMVDKLRDGYHTKSIIAD